MAEACLFGTLLDECEEEDLRYELMRLDKDNGGNKFMLVNNLRSAFSNGSVLSITRPELLVSVETLSDTVIGKLSIKRLREALTARNITFLKKGNKSYLGGLLCYWERRRGALIENASGEIRSTADDTETMDEVLEDEAATAENLRLAQLAEAERLILVASQLQATRFQIDLLRQTQMEVVSVTPEDLALAAAQAELSQLQAASKSSSCRPTNTDYSVCFANQNPNTYDAGAGNVLLSDLLSSDLGLHQEVGTGMLVNLVPFDHILSGHGVVFFKGTTWENSRLKQVYVVDRVRSVHGDRYKEVDLTLWLNFDNLSTNSPVERITLSETDSQWAVYVANEEGVRKLSAFANSEVGVSRQKLKPAVIEEVQRGTSQYQGVVVESLRDSEAKKSKSHLRAVLGKVTEHNPAILLMWDAACLQGTNITASHPPSNFTMRLGIYLNSSHSVIKAIQTERHVVYLLVTGRHSDSYSVPVSGVREHVTLTELSDGGSANIDSSAGLANLWDCYLRVMDKFRGLQMSTHGLREAVAPFVASLRDRSDDEGALGNIDITYLQALVLKIWVNLGLAFDDSARLGTSDIEVSRFNLSLKELFAVDAATLENNVIRHKRMMLAKRKLVTDEGTVSKKGLPQQGGGGGRIGGGRGNPVVNGQGRGRGGGGHIGIPGRGIVTQGPPAKSGSICVANLQHLLVSSDKCIHGPNCKFSHAPIVDFDRATVKAHATKVIHNQGRLSAVMVKLNDMTLKFLNE